MARNPLLSVLAAAGLLPLRAVAAGNPDQAELAASPIGSGALFETMVGLIVIIALIFGLGWLFRRFGKLPIAGKGMVSVLGGVSLGPRERAVVLQVDGIRLLVGVAPGRVQTLHVLNDGPDSGDRFSEQLDSALEETS